MVRKLLLMGLLPIAGIATFAALFFFYYRGTYAPPPSVDIPFEQITSPGVAPSPPMDTGGFQPEHGLMVIDALHDNFFSESEIVTLVSWVADRGYEVEVLGGESVEEKSSGTSLLEQRLKLADSLVVMLPRDPYTEAEVRLVEDFVDKGGKLLLVSDPTRPNLLNGLAKRFGLEFRSDYLYNTVEYDQNFRNIFVRDFQPDALTNGLDTIALYVASSLRSSGPALATTDANTQSSLIEAERNFSPIAWGNKRNVLAIGDFTFMVPPYNSLLSNDKLLSNLADFLTDSQRSFELADFPYFFTGGDDQNVDILLGQDQLWDSGVLMRGVLSSVGVPSGISADENLGRDTVFLGLYEDVSQVERYIQSAGVSVGAGITLPSGLEIKRDDASLTILHEDEDRHVLVLLAETPRALSSAVDALIGGKFKEDLVNDFVGVRNRS